MGAEGRGFTAGCEEGWCRKVLKFDRPFAGGFLGLTALRAEGCGGALWAHIEKRGAAGADIKKAPKAAANPGPNSGSPGRGPGGCLNPGTIGA